MAADVNFGAWVPSASSRNIPAGTVVDPGSQLLYIVDTGINISAAVEAGQFTEADVAAQNVNGLLGITGAAGEVQTNFISITNTHPTKAVTIHFRYFNDECEDVLDFLVILTCNDTLLFNPFDFEIPAASLGGNQINTKSRIFGPDLSDAFPAIKGDKFACGRFLIFATAAATVRLDTDTEKVNAPVGGMGLLGGAFWDDSTGPGYNHESMTWGFDALGPAGALPPPNPLANAGPRMTTFAAFHDYNALSSPGNILFPFELGVELDQECNIDASGVTFRALKDGIHEPNANPALIFPWRNVGSTGGLSHNNLHVFNAAGANFNYLIGHKATAVPKGFIAGVQSDQDRFLAFGVNAWTRPAVHGLTGSFSQLTNFRNGDGAPLDSLNIPDYALLMGTEILMRRSDTTGFLTPASSSPNPFYLRQEAHGGDTVRAVTSESAGNANGPRVSTSGTNLDIGGPDQTLTGWGPDGSFTTNDVGHNGPGQAPPGGPFPNGVVDNGVGVGGSSWYGALAWISLHTTDPLNQIMHLLSFVDDYDGSKNTAVAATVSGASIFDRSYNLTGAQTRYILQIYDNMENKLDITTTTPINISPPPTVAPTANLRIIVDCLKVWINGVIDPLTKRYGLRIKDLYDITDVVRTGGSGRHGDASGSLNNDVRPFKGLAYPVNPLEDASQGWIRLVRDNNFTRSRTFSFTPPGGGVTNTRTVTITGGTIAPIDHVIMDNLRHPTFVTIGEINTRFEGFGAAWWAAAAAQDPATSNAPVINPSP